MHHSFLGLVFNITVLLLEYKRVALAQSFSLGYKPIRPSYFNPEHPGHHPAQIIAPGWLWPADPPGSISTTLISTTVPSTTASTIMNVQIPNRRPDLPQQGVDQIVDNTNTPIVNHWFRPVIITNTVNGVTSERTTTSSTTLVSFSTMAGSPQVQFLPEGDLFTSAPVRRNPIETPSGIPYTPTPPSSTATSTIVVPPYIESGEINVTGIVADLLPLPIDLTKNVSIDNLNLLLPVLPLNAPKTNDIN